MPRVGEHRDHERKAQGRKFDTKKGQKGKQEKRKEKGVSTVKVP